jgi:hypothetical protein
MKAHSCASSDPTTMTRPARGRCARVCRRAYVLQLGLILKPIPPMRLRLAHAQHPAYAPSARLMLGFVLGLMVKPNATRTRSPPCSAYTPRTLATLFKPTSCTQSTAPGPTNTHGSGPQAQRDSDFTSLHPRILAWRIHNEQGR